MHKEKRYFVHTGGNGEKSHNKFWVVWQEAENSVSTMNGRLGTKGQTRTKESDKGLSWSSYEASRYYQTKIDEKMYRKGYREVDQEKFELMSKYAEAVGSANKLMATEWVGFDNSELSVRPIPKNDIMDPDADIALLATVETRKVIDDYNVFDIAYTNHGVYARPKRYVVTGIESGRFSAVAEDSDLGKIAYKAVGIVELKVGT